MLRVALYPSNGQREIKHLYPELSYGRGTRYQVLHDELNKVKTT